MPFGPRETKVVIMWGKLRLLPRREHTLRLGVLVLIVVVLLLLVLVILLLLVMVLLLGHCRRWRVEWARKRRVPQRRLSGSRSSNSSRAS